jgi:hypothetical protein
VPHQQGHAVCGLQMGAEGNFYYIVQMDASYFAFSLCPSQLPTQIATYFLPVQYRYIYRRTKHSTKSISRGFTEGLNTHL